MKTKTLEIFKDIVSAAAGTDKIINHDRILDCMVNDLAESLAISWESRFKDIPVTRAFAWQYFEQYHFEIEDDRLLW